MLLGTAGWLSVGAPVLEATGHSLGPKELLAGTIVCAGASVLPDLDHPQATITNSLGPVTRTISKVLCPIVGGHRNGTHSILFCALMALITSTALSATSSVWPAFLIAMFCAALMLHTLADMEGIGGVALSAIIGMLVVTLAPNPDWIWLAVTLGCILHLIGDFLTPEGVPLLWPINKTRFKMPVVGHTGDWRENGISFVCAGMTIVSLLPGAGLINLTAISNFFAGL